ncbi:unnamed protein product [Dibothriocephalus latus]|uniref:Uncharacterized protein n=1 Tax=Dibothriocephalus latus TaxID=60516 RepID=A0A3P7P494_DIBLA|nr:unnamed protein product [Dibothriocephalus latus]
MRTEDYDDMSQVFLVMLHTQVATALAAQESRDPVFDLSGCNLPQLPRGVEAQVRVFQKTVLLLHSNCLKQLCSSGKPGDLANLVHLDLHANRFDILNISQNKLRILPVELGNLRSLQVLNVEDNLLSSLPDSLGDLTNLRELCLDRNPLQTLPLRLGRLRQLKKLTVPLDSLSTPPRGNALACIESLYHILSPLLRPLPTCVKATPTEHICVLCVCVC